MKPFKENDAIQLREPVEANLIGERRMLLIPAKTVGAVVLVHGESSNPLAYEVEFFIATEKSFALATVDARLVEAISSNTLL